MKMIRHILIVCISILIIMGIPLFFTSGFQKWLNNDPDALSSASVILDQPSGNYVIFINEAVHPNKENLETWKKFFKGEEISFLFEDITCYIATGDGPGLMMAQSYQSRLPANQMILKMEDGTLMISKAEHGIFDIMILSKEMADNLHVETLDMNSVIRIDVKGEANA